MIEEKLSEICFAMESCDITDIGLMTGLSGVNVFLSTIKPKNFEKIIERNLITILGQINNGFNGFSYCSGIAGFLWSIKYLINNKVIENKWESVFEKLEPFLYQRMKLDLERNQWDFLHSAIGIALMSLYLNSDSIINRFANETIDALNSLGISDEKGRIKWKSNVIKNDKSIEVYNLSLAHGIASIIALTTKTYMLGLNKYKSKNILMGAIQFLLMNKNDLSKYNCYFPSWIKGSDIENSSRLGWCYGDLGIGITLLNAADALNDKNLKEFSLSVLRHTTSRRNLDKELVMDAGICHGTSGIAHIYYRVFRNTKEEVFNEAASFWFERTLLMGHHQNGAAGYMAYLPDQNVVFEKEYGILQGIAGIGLSLYSWKNQTEPTWDECLLLR